MSQGDVLVIGDEVNHLVERNQLDAFAGPRADVRTWAIARFRGGPGQGCQLHAIGSLGLLQGLQQMLGTHGLDQVTHGADLKGVQRKLIVGRAKHHSRRRVALAQTSSDLQAIEAGHADVEQHHIRLEAVDQAECFFTIAGAGFHYSIALEVTDHPAQALAGEGFVINDQDIHIALDSCVSLAHG
jgi:hypothetical protein